MAACRVIDAGSVIWVFPRRSQRRGTFLVHLARREGFCSPQNPLKTVYWAVKPCESTGGS